MFKLKPNIGRYAPHGLSGDTWGIMDRKTGELLKRNNQLERYPYQWATQRCDDLNK